MRTEGGGGTREFLGAFCSVLFCSFGQVFSLLWTHAFFINRRIALAQGAEEFG